jgi:hypothetical protein
MLFEKFVQWVIWDYWLKCWLKVLVNRIYFLSIYRISIDWRSNVQINEIKIHNQVDTCKKKTKVYKNKIP